MHLRLICLPVLCFVVSVVSSLPCAADSSAPSQKTAVVAPQKNAAPAMPVDMQKALTQLDAFAEKRLKVICDKIRPNKATKDVSQAGIEYIARYLEIDVSSLATEITLAQGRGAKYIGSVIYYEQIFESRGATRAAALAGEFELVKLRHITELFRYDKGKWID